jgi:hypothetical protein
MIAVSIGTERLLKGAGISSEEMQPSQTPLAHTRIHERVSDCAGRKARIQDTPTRLLYILQQYLQSTFCGPSRERRSLARSFVHHLPTSLHLRPQRTNQRSHLESETRDVRTTIALLQRHSQKRSRTYQSGPGCVSDVNSLLSDSHVESRWLLSTTQQTGILFNASQTEVTRRHLTPHATVATTLLTAGWLVHPKILKLLRRLVHHQNLFLLQNHLPTDTSDIFTVIHSELPPSCILHDKSFTTPIPYFRFTIHDGTQKVQHQSRRWRWQDHQKLNQETCFQQELHHPCSGLSP